MRSSTRWPLWLLAVVLAVRACVPTGWMPTAGDDGVRVMLCTGAGPVALVLHPGGERHAGDDAPQEARDPCPFALSLGKAISPAPPIAAAGPPPPREQAGAATVSAVGAIVRRSLRPPARAPPIPV